MATKISSRYWLTSPSPTPSSLNLATLSVDPGVGYHFDVAPGPASEIGDGGDFSLLQEIHERGPKVLVDLGLNSIGY